MSCCSVYRKLLLGRSCGKTVSCRLLSSSSTTKPTKVETKAKNKEESFTAQSNTESKTLPQAPNYPNTWSSRQMSRSVAMNGPRFETVDLSKQPAPAAAISLIASVPVKVVKDRIVACDGGDGPRGHPRIYINLVS